MINTEFLKFLYEFHYTRDYYECHEILEALWIKETKCKTKNNANVLLLQIAVACYHHRRKNFVGALGIYTRLVPNLIKNAHLIEAVLIDSKSLIILVRQQLMFVKQEKNFKDYRLPLKEELLNTFLHKYHLTTDSYSKPSNLNDFKKINAHIKTNTFKEE